jgi:signal transduction histidine kinase
MDQETLSRAFEAFYTTKKSKGTGLGLSLCYSIITGHGGTIEIDSTPNEGTKVRIFLPLPTDNEVDTL